MVALPLVLGDGGRSGITNDCTAWKVVASGNAAFSNPFPTLAYCVHPIIDSFVRIGYQLADACTNGHFDGTIASSCTSLSALIAWFTWIKFVAWSKQTVIRNLGRFHLAGPIPWTDALH